MNALVFIAMLALATPIFGEEALEAKRQEKRGVVGLGYGNSYLNGLGYGYNGLSHGYLNNINAPYYLGHSSGTVAPVAPIAPIAPIARVAPVAPVYTAPAYPAPAYTAPLAYNYNHAVNPIYNPLRLGHAGVSAHNLGYYNSW